MSEFNFSQFGDALDDIRSSPADGGTVQMIVRRPTVDEREVLDQAYLDTTGGLIGDDWLRRGTDPAKQVTLMNARVAALVAKTRDRWPLAGDQFYVDLDLSEDNLAPGTRLAVGSAIVEVSAEPHRGCKKFAARFGVDALRLVNSPLGDRLRMRGINARVIRAGLVRTGDPLGVCRAGRGEDATRAA
jgi:MOSC domain-containing protein YiiM